MKKLLIPVALMSALIITSCKKDSSSSGGGEVSYRLQPTSYSATLMGATKGNTISGASSVTWTSGSMIISEIDFEAKKEKLEIEYELKQIVSVNLFDLSPVLGNISIPDGTYDEVELKLDIKKSDSGVAPLVLKGEYIDANGVKTPIEYSFNENIEIEVEAENVIITSADYIGMINLQLSKFLTNVSISDLAQVTKINGKILISSTSNSALYFKIKNNLNFVADCDFDKK